MKPAEYENSDEHKKVDLERHGNEQCMGPGRRVKSFWPAFAAAYRPLYAVGLAGTSNGGRLCSEPRNQVTGKALNTLT